MTTGRLRPTIDKAAAGELAGAVLGARVHVDVQIPRTDITGRMRLVSRSEAMAIVAEARALFADRQMPVDASALASPGVMNEWNCEIAVRHLAVAVRNPDPNKDAALASLEEWRECDDQQVSALWEQYKDLEDRLDPLAKLEDLATAELAALRSAAKKKEADLLTSYGSRKLARFAISLVEDPAS